MKIGTGSFSAFLVAAISLALLPEGWSQAPGQESPIDRYRHLEFPPVGDENFDRGWQERVILEFEIVNDAELESLRSTLEDKTPFMRSIAIRALGIRGDQGSVERLAELAVSDPEPTVRGRAIEALGLLKARPEVIERAKKDKDGGVVWTANLAAEQAASEIDFLAAVRDAYAGGINREELDLATVGKAAPDFSALTLDGKTFKLSSILGKKPIVIYFTAHDG